MSVCAVIPAAGRGSRLGLDCPKIMTQVAHGVTIWDLLISKLSSYVDHICIVLSDAGFKYIDENSIIVPPNVTLHLQAEPMGMGDAIFSAFQTWKCYEKILVIWGDQACVSEATLSNALVLSNTSHAPNLVIPVVSVISPYVEYCFEANRIVSISQSREGDICNPKGLSDIGTFILSTEDLLEHWKSYLKNVTLGAKTNEINFLPFLKYLSENKHRAYSMLVDDPNESIGVNTQEDLQKIIEIIAGGRD